MKQTGNTILVTGGGSGIGEALAQRFHDLGNTVIVAGRRQEALDRAIAGREHMAAMTLDIGDAGAIEDFARRAIAEHPDLNVLINNAGIMRRSEEHTSELQSLMRTSYAVFCLNKKQTH